MKKERKRVDDPALLKAPGCPKCGARMNTRTVIVAGNMRKLAESSCFICGTIEYPTTHVNPHIVVLDFDKHMNLFLRLQKRAAEYDSFLVEEIMHDLEDYLNVLEEYEKKQSREKVA